jgi:hypothetical protein
MANRTDPDAGSIHGTNPQYLIEKILRSRIYESRYWKEQCFGLTAETLIDRAVQLDAVGGTFSHNAKPTAFLCLALKLLAIQPPLDVVRAYCNQSDYKYLRALGAFYLRLTGRALDCYRYLEPLLVDSRKLCVRTAVGWRLTTVDQFVDELLVSDISCEVALPRLSKRSVFEATGALAPRDEGLAQLLEDATAAGDELEQVETTTAQGVEVLEEETGAFFIESKISALETGGRRDNRPAWLIAAGGSVEGAGAGGAGVGGHSAGGREGRASGVVVVGAGGGDSDDGGEVTRPLAGSVRPRPIPMNEKASTTAATGGGGEGDGGPMPFKKPKYAPWGSKKVDKTHPTAATTSTSVPLADTAAEGSVEYWNFERAKLGLAPLK